MKCPVTGDWLDGVIYTGEDGRLRSTSRALGRTVLPVAEVPESDLSEAQMAMVRRTNPGDIDLDWRKIFESWHEVETGINGHALELAIAAVMERMANWPIDPQEPVEITIQSSDLQRVLENFEIERVPVQHGFTIRLTRAQ